MTTLNVCNRSFDQADSYGLIAAHLVEHLSAKGVHVNAHASRSKDSGIQSDKLKMLLSKPHRRADGSIVLGYPTNLEKFPSFATLSHPRGAADGGPRVIVTMWESSRCPAEWIPILNTFDAVVTPSTFCRDVFRDSGVTAPIHVVPLGVGEVYQYSPRKADKKDNNSGAIPPLTFLAFTDRGARKGWQTALTAFLMAFGDDINYRLILKSRDPKQRVIFTNPNIDVIQRDMSEQELYELFLIADVLINPHKGEGWGLLPREFCASGGIALTTAWSGTADALDQWGYALPYTLEKATWPATKFEGQELGEWAKVDAADVAERLRHVAEHIDGYGAVAQEKARNVQRLYSWQTFAETVLSVWEGVRVGDNTANYPVTA